METVNSTGLVNQVFLRCVEDCFEPIMLTDKFGSLVYVNPSWTLTYGYRKDEAMGKTPRILRSSSQSDEIYKNMWKTILDPSVGFWRGEVVNKAKDGHLVPVLLTITPYRNELTGDILGYMGIAVDLTDQKRMEEQILSQDRLSSIGLLATGLAHEIGNPLGVIRGRTELVMSQLNGNIDAEKNLSIILSQIDRISGLIQSLLRVSRAPAEHSFQEVQLLPVVEEVFTLMKETCRKAGVELIHSNLQQTVIADVSHLQQLFLNLILNSLHAIEEQKNKNLNSGKHSISIEVQKIEHKKCFITVTDTGCGIAQENIEKIFQPFFTTKPAGQGTGMGLAVVLKILQEMKGKVSVTSDGVGRGATFQIELNVH